MSSVLGGFRASSRACGSTGPASTAFVLDDDGRHRVTLEKSLHISPKLRLLPQ
jgi:hypothetical protein